MRCSRWRRLRGAKQSHAAELFGVTQATFSRWERGHHRIPEAATRQLSRLLAAPLNSAGDAGLRRLVESSALPVHLICDLTHRLLAASQPRFAEWKADEAQLRGISLLGLRHRGDPPRREPAGRHRMVRRRRGRASVLDRRQRRSGRADRSGNPACGNGCSSATARWRGSSRRSLRCNLADEYFIRGLTPRPFLPSPA